MTTLISRVKSMIVLSACSFSPVICIAVNCCLLMVVGSVEIVLQFSSFLFLAFPHGWVERILILVFGSDELIQYGCIEVI